MTGQQEDPTPLEEAARRDALIDLKIRSWRDSLIDLSKRNPLLALPRGVVRLEADADDLWKLPPTGKRGAFRLLPLPDANATDAANAAAIMGSEESSEVSTAPASSSGKRLPPPRTQFITAETSKRLNNLRLKSRLSLTEQGINVLFVTLGTLEWIDPKAGALRSPLLLLPVELTRLTEEPGFLLSRFEDDAALNPTLQYRLAQPDVHLLLPDIGGDEEALTPSAYLSRLSAQVAPRAGWRVVMDECLLGRFSYLRLAMYEDLSRQSDVARQKPVIRALAGAPAALSMLPAVEVPADGALDELDPERTHYVLPADPSQQQAVLAARMGQSFVLQGPPGAGKTQTIANLIAACIADGRKVLFVSEKMAALDAVYKRLGEKGLADFCLEAHSHKANKKDILEQLRRALSAAERSGPPPPPYPLLSALRAELDGHAAALHEPRYPLGLSVYQARGIAASLANAPELPFVFTAPEVLTPEDLHRCELLAERLAGFHPLFAAVDTHPWLALKEGTRFSAELQARVRDAVDRLLRHADSAPAVLNSLRRACGLSEADEERLAPADAARLIGLAELLEATPRPERAWVESTDATVRDLRATASETQERYRRYTERRKGLLEHWSEEVFDLPHTELADRLTGRHEQLLRPFLGETWADRSDEALAAADAAAARLAGTARVLRQGARRLADLCGLSAADSVTAARAAGEIAALALTDPRPRPGWFDAGGIERLYSLARETQQRQQEIRAARAALDPVYRPEALAPLDIDALHTRFATDYSGFLRWFKPGFYRDRGTLRAALAPGATLAGRDQAADLLQARTRRDAAAWLDAHAAELSDRFGAHHYRGEATDWSALGEALRQTEMLCTAFGGGPSVPTALQQRVVASGALMAELRDQHTLFTGQEEEFDAAVRQTAAAALALPAADVVPLGQMRLADLEEWADRVRPALADFTEARAAARSPYRGTAPCSVREMARDLREAETVRREDEAIRAEALDLERRYAHFFSGFATDWDEIVAALDWTERLHRALGAAGERLTDATTFLAADGDRAALGAVGAARTALQQVLADADALWPALNDLFRPEFLRAASGDGTPLQDAFYEAQRTFAEARVCALSDLEPWLAFQQLRTESADAGLLSFYEVTARRSPAPADIVPAFRRGFYQRWLDAVIAGVPELHSFTGELQETRRARLAELEQGLLRANPGRIRAVTKERRDLTGRADVGEVAVLKRLLSMRKPRASVRKILAEIPTLLFRLTPCLLMSPLSVSLFLDADRLWFDLVVFDEASQVYVESALGALLRADQAIIAGDTRQLPPTSFFKGLQDEESEADEEEDADAPLTASAAAHEFDSILAAAAAVANADSPHFPERELTWHYRSRHESLIAFSRRNFYQKLETFPSASRPSALRFVHVPDGVYLGGAGRPRNNPVEAGRVADLVLEQLAAEPHLSVGVITMSEAQQAAVSAELDRRRAAGPPELARLLAEDPTEERPEPLFVKNIENVQGDERDVIFLSIGYGRNPERKLYQRFGPINAEGGERRLNVAVTRARTRCVTVASILPGEIAVTEDTRPGPRLLREYLETARSAAATSDAAAPDSGASPDLLAESVARSLEARGHTVHRGVGLFQYKVDVAVADPSSPDRYLLGIECDGPVYASGRTAAGREVMRAEVLRALGWRLARVWSADWLRNPEAVLQSLEGTIERARRGEPEYSEGAPPRTRSENELPSDEGAPTGSANSVSTATASTAGDSDDRRDVSAMASTTGHGLLPGLTCFEPYIARPLPAGPETLYGDAESHRKDREAFLLALAAREGPIHEDAVAAALTRAAGLQRTGERIARIIQGDILRLVRAEKLEARPEETGTFLWPAGMRDAPARTPSPGSLPRPIEQISRAEIGEVIVALLRSAIGMRQEEVVLETARVLGYERTGNNVRERIEKALAELEFDNKVHVRGGQVYTFEE